MLPRLKVEQAINTSTDRKSMAGESSHIFVNSERVKMAELVSENNEEGMDTDSEIGQYSERLTTPAKS